MLGHLIGITDVIGHLGLDDGGFSPLCFYVYSFDHKELWLVILLWFFALAAPMYTFLSVLFMSSLEFKENFKIEIKDESLIGKIRIKTIRAFREVFQIHKSDEFKKKDT